MKKYYVLSIFLTFFSILSFGQLDIDTVFINREPSKGFAPYSVPAVLTDLSKNIYVFGASASPQFYSGIQVI